MEMLGWRDIPINRRETQSETDLQEAELEEDIRRKDRSWQEKCIAIAKIHRLKVSAAASDRKEWGQKMTGEMLGISVGNVNYCLRVADWLRDPNHLAWKCDGVSDAYRRCYLKPREDEALAELARRTQSLANSESPPTNDLPSVEITEPPPPPSNDVLADARERYYSNPLNPPDSFEQYWAERTAEEAKRANKVAISRRLHNGDSIAWMKEHPASVDHVITDIPYGIDMDNLDQSGDLGMASIDLVREEHDVDYNRQLIADFFPAAFTAVRDNGFLATCCDIDLWAFMKDNAEAAGWRVQRWPITWVKTNPCANKAAAFNTTKDTEAIMLCAKPGSTLANHVGTSVIHADNREAVATTGHPFAKPFELTRFLLDAISLPGQTILDPFAGRGSMVLEFVTSNRKWIAVEKQTAHFNALVENIKQHYLKINPNFSFE